MQIEVTSEELDLIQRLINAWNRGTPKEGRR